MAQPTNFQTINPSNLNQLETYFYLNPIQIEGLLEKASQNWKSWRTSSVKTRNEYIQFIAEELARVKNELAEMMAIEMGKPIPDGLAEVEKCILTCQHYANKLEAYLMPEEVSANYKKSWIQIASLGPVLCIMPWNFPVWQVIRFAIPALALGNTVILKHSDITAGVGQILERVFLRDPKKQIFFNAILTHTSCESVIKDPRVKAVSFTGSERGGREIAKLAGEFLKKSVLELGGSDAYLVLEDAELDLATESCVQARMINNGQSCVAAKRFFVHQTQLESFVEKIKLHILKYKIGDPRSPGTKVGPLSHLKFKEALQGQVNQLKVGSIKAEVLTAGPQSAAFFDPQYLICPLTNTVAHQTELFGPVFLIFPYEDEKQALHWANSSPFGLGGAIFSKDMDRAMALAGLFDSGMVAINTLIKSDPRLPFGGIKNSGYGRELGRWGFYEFANVKTVGIG